MYFINEEQIELRLRFISVITDACVKVVREWNEDDVLISFAQDRALHLAIECVTDIGSLLIDAFILRDASSYEDIVDILHGEQAFSDDIAEALKELVRLRKPLVQEYASTSAGGLHPLTSRLPEVLSTFRDEVGEFIRKEMAQS